MARKLIAESLATLADRLKGEVVRRQGDLSGELQQPPPVPPGLDIGPPDFVGLGAQKSGTSYWYNLLVQHPAVYHPTHFEGKIDPAFISKERHFFDRFFQTPLDDRARADFQRWFARPPGMITGEWTPRYLIEHWTPVLLREMAPNVKLLVILRDPVERFVSGMNHNLRRGGSLSADDAHEHFLRGLYASQLEMWLRYFDRESILVLQFERCMRDPVPFLKETHEFLGLDTVIPSLDIVLRPRHVSRRKAFKLHDVHRQALVDAYSDDVQRLATLVPGLDVSEWRHFSDLAERSA